MTGLYNKGRVRELIEEALLVPDTENALLVLDMDGFKSVNDQLGHLTGDAVISDMALSLQATFRQTDIVLLEKNHRFWRNAIKPFKISSQFVKTVHFLCSAVNSTDFLSGMRSSNGALKERFFLLNGMPG